MAILNRLLGGDDTETESSNGAEDPLLEDQSDDPFATPDADLDDEFSELDDEFGAFDEMQEETADTAELENRLDELENEVGSLSSSVNTVKSENEEISGSLQEIEENVRQLLEIYEMVTRGVNPFVDESEVSATSGSMELFSTDDSSNETDIDDSIASADAEEFFDDDLADEGGADEGDPLFEESTDESDPFAEEEDSAAGFEAEFRDPEPMDDESDSNGKSFEELKAEYESGQADWASDGETNGHETGDHETDELETGGLGVDDQEIESTEMTVEATDGGETDESGSTAGTAPTGEKPYVEEIPAGYVSDLVVMEWLEFLVDVSNIEGASRAIAYYESIGWVSESAADTLQAFLEGFEGGGELASDPPPHPSLNVDHHARSLRYIARLHSASEGALAMAEWDGPDSDFRTSADDGFTDAADTDDFPTEDETPGTNTAESSIQEVTTAGGENSDGGREEHHENRSDDEDDKNSSVEDLHEDRSDEPDPLDEVEEDEGFEETNGDPVAGGSPDADQPDPEALFEDLESDGQEDRSLPGESSFGYGKEYADPIDESNEVEDGIEDRAGGVDEDDETKHA